jgi:hypothetical protein
MPDMRLLPPIDDQPQGRVRGKGASARRRTLSAATLPRIMVQLRPKDGM